MTVTFFGHRTAQNDIQPKLEACIIDLIEKNDFVYFLVGNNGNFDAIVIKTLKLLSKKYSNMNYAIVLAYLPSKKN